MEDEKYIGQRGPDVKPREFNPKSLSNLKQFQKPVPSTNPSVNSGVNWSKLGKFAIIAIVISTLVWKLSRWKKHPEDTK